ncbi:hypothetical protein ACN077_24620 [Clostridium chromiireducens]|uniref:hypothetical protein n=1 Tax=Clostridium chromiireducens TaxID=225345 RepID=UPI003AF7AFB9
MAFEPGNTVYIIENNRNIREATVVRSSGRLFLIRFGSGGGMLTGYMLPKRNQRQ